MTNSQNLGTIEATNPVLAVAPLKEETEMLRATEKITALYCRLSQEDANEGGHLCVKNLSAFWLPEFTLQKEIGGTVYTVTGSYDGVETLDRKMERIMGEKFAEKMEDSE